MLQIHCGYLESRGCWKEWCVEDPGIAEPTLHPHPWAGESWTGLPTGNRPGSSHLFDLSAFLRWRGEPRKFLAQKTYEFFGLFFSCLPEMDLCCLLFTAPSAGIKWVLPFWDRKCYCSQGFCSPFVTGSLQGMTCFQGSSGRSWLFVKACLLLLYFIIL